MTEEIIKRKTGSYGRVNIVLPISAKQSILSWMTKSGLKKAQFFRTALLIGSVQLAEQLGIKEKSDDHFVNLRNSPPGGDEDGLLAKRN
jgi:hypothetical protein